MLFETCNPRAGSTYHTQSFVMKTKSYGMERLREVLFSGYEAVISAILAFGAAFFAPVWPFIAGMTFMIIVDQYTGRKAARSRGEDINSGGKKRTVHKFVLYALAILGAEAINWIFFKALPFPVPITYWVAFQIIWTEYTSIIENVRQVTKTRIDLKKIAEEKLKGLVVFPRVKK
jgi:Bacteriophage holin family